MTSHKLLPKSEQYVIGQSVNSYFHIVAAADEIENCSGKSRKWSTHCKNAWTPKESPFNEAGTVETRTETFENDEKLESSDKEEETVN